MQLNQYDLTSAAYENFKKVQAAQPQYVQFNFNKLAYSVNELLAVLPIGRTSLYAAIKTGKLKGIKLGKKTLFLAQNVSDFLSALPAMKNGEQS